MSSLQAGVQVWKDALSVKASAPYLNHLLAGGGTSAVSARFCPYDDALGVGHTRGICSLLVRRCRPPVLLWLPTRRIAALRRDATDARLDARGFYQAQQQPRRSSDISWAASEGFSCTVPPHKLHVPR